MKNMEEKYKKYFEKAKCVSNIVTGDWNASWRFLDKDYYCSYYNYDGIV
jgi:hypothetical protein